MKYEALSHDAKSLYDQNYKVFYKYGVIPRHRGVSITFGEFMCTLATNNIVVHFVPRGQAVCMLGGAVRQAGGDPEMLLANIRHSEEYCFLRNLMEYDLEAMYLG